MILPCNAHQLKKLHISFFGGEPLLEKKIIYFLLDEIRNIKNEFGFSVEGDITSNCSLLTIPCLKKLSENGIKTIQVSLDVIGEVHNETRIFKNGKGSFDQIISRMKDALSTDLDFLFLVRMHVTQKNKEHITNLSNFIDEYFSNDPRIIKNYKGITNLQKMNNTTNDTKYNNDSYAKKEDIPQTKRNKPQDFICYAAKPNALVIRSNGNLAKCTVAFNHEKSQVGYLGENGSIIIDKKSSLGGLEGLTKEVYTLHAPQKT